MKTLFILRHGKAQGDGPRGDFERALTGRGERDTRAISEKIAKLDTLPDLIVSSNARRARQTAQIVAEELEIEERVALEPQIYGADLDTLLGVVRGLPDSALCVLMVGHNPGFVALGDALSGQGEEVGELPTAGLVHLEFAADSWREAQEGSGRLVGVHRPGDA